MIESDLLYGVIGLIAAIVVIVVLLRSKRKREEEEGKYKPINNLPEWEPQEIVYVKTLNRDRRSKGLPRFTPDKRLREMAYARLDGRYKSDFRQEDTHMGVAIRGEDTVVITYKY